jgi:hypothetical protein
MKASYLLSLIVVLGAMTIDAPGQDVQVSASVSTDTVGVQDQLQYTITVSGRDSGDAETPRVPRFHGFQVVAGPSVSTQFQWINGRTSSTKSFIWVLLPEKEGKFTIDPVEVRVGSQTFRTQPLSIVVTPGSAQPSQPRSRAFDSFNDEGIRPRAQITGEEVFVTAEVDRTSPYPGQQVTLSYHLYTQVGVTGVQLKESPTLTGFWVEELEVPPNPTGVRKTVNGREYLEFVIGKRALFPNTPGKLRIPESTFAVSAKSAGDFLGIFGQTETLYRKTRELTLDVKPLPISDRPVGFGNAVGSFNLTSSLDKSTAATGEAVTLRVKLSGRGNLKMLPDISLPVLPDFTVYSSKRVDNLRPVEGNLIGGDKTWEYVIVPKAPGDQVIPALSMSYFDPEREEYETVTAQSLSLKVTRGEDGGGTISGLSGFTKQNLTRQGSDINFIKLAAGDLDRRGDPIYRSPWLYLLALAPLAFNVGLLIYQRETARQSENVALVRSRKARRTALSRLRKAEKGNKGEARRFYDEAAVALSGYLADRFNLPEIALTGDSLERTLSEKSVPTETLNAIQACLQECDFGRFVSATPGKTGVLASRIRKVIDSLEQV